MVGVLIAISGEKTKKKTRDFTRFSWWISMVISMGFSMGRILKNGDFSGRFLEITRFNHDFPNI